jgi:hypothetical protein
MIQILLLNHQQVKLQEELYLSEVTEKSLMAEKLLFMEEIQIQTKKVELYLSLADYHQAEETAGQSLYLEVWARSTAPREDQCK